jgi:hypothetical protein
MSDHLPKPLASINALRAHLRLLERGVNDARTRRVGPAEVPALVPVPVRQSTPAPAMRPQAPFQLTPRQPSDKPKARAKGATDFSAFFGSIDKRAAS